MIICNIVKLKKYWISMFCLDDGISQSDIKLSGIKILPNLQNNRAKRNEKAYVIYDINHQ